MKAFAAVVALVAGSSFLSGASRSAAAQSSTLPQPTAVSLFVGSWRWLPRPDRATGLGHGGWRALSGRQIERGTGTSPWGGAVSARAAGSVGGCTDSCGDPGSVIEAAVTHRFTAPGGWMFGYLGAGPGLVSFDERHVAASARAGVGIGRRAGVRLEGRRQYLFGATEPSAYAVSVGVHW